jgi:hypothetical protein
MKELELQRILRGRSELDISQEREMSEFVQGLAPWDTFFTGTFRTHTRETTVGSRHFLPGFGWSSTSKVRTIDLYASEDSARRSFVTWWDLLQPDVPVVFGIDPDPSGFRPGSHHIHGIMATSGGLFRRPAFLDWLARFGRNRIEPIFNIGGVSGYVAKYPLTGARHWEIRNCVQMTTGMAGAGCNPVPAMPV